MPRYKLTIEYDGGPFCGWQWQATGRSVQQALEEALTRFTGEAPTVHAAGRTDAGVHATGQVAHIELGRPWMPDKLQSALNFYLKPEPVAILAVETVADDFHARFSAVERRYCYRLLNRRAPAAIDHGRVWHIVDPLDLEAMQAGARHLLGTHDFTSFRATYCQARSAIKTLDQLDVVKVSAEEVRIIARARSFLHHQVRNMVGTLVLVGRGKWQPDDVAAALAARDRAAAGPTAPPDGLYLTGVGYPTVETRPT